MRFRLFLIVLILAVAGCGNSSTNEAGKVDIVATTSQIADFAKNVGGDLVNVRTVLKPGIDPHEFEATPADIDAMHNAEVIVRNGVNLESWFDSTVKSADTKAKVVDASTGVQVHDNDPHIWQDPRNAKQMVDNITDALKQASPENAAKFDENRVSYNAQLDALDAEIASQISSLPDKKMVTDHDAIDYYIERYGLVHVGSVIESFDSQAELSALDINKLVDLIKSTGAKAIFVEQSVSSKTAQTIASEAGVKVVSGEDSLYADTLAESGEGSTYLGAMRHNTKVIVDNLR